MHFVVNGRFLAKAMTGVRRVGHEMLRALLEELEARPRGRRPALEIAAPEGVALERAAAAGVRVVRGPATLLGEQTWLPWLRSRATIVSFAGSTPLLAPRAIWWVHDAHVFDAPESYARMYRLGHQALLRACVLRRFRIVTVSEHSRRALLRHGADGSRLSVIHNGGDHVLRCSADTSWADGQGLAEQSFVLLVGSRARHKNLPFAVTALARRLPTDVQIVVVGLHQPGPYAHGDAIGADPRVMLLPMVSDAQLRALYERACCVVIPSVREGFSLPTAEAMWCGAPLVLANRTALPEVGGEAALYFEPDDAVGLAERVTATFDPEVRARLRDKCRIQREAFRWRASARQFLEEFLTPA